MSAIATAPPAPQRPHPFQRPRPSVSRAQEGHRAHSAPRTDYVALDPNVQRRGGVVLFTVPFTSAMTGADLSVLAHVLDLSTHMQAKMRPDPNSPGVARLDHFSGLFLERGATEGQWLLQARTWGRPTVRTVHEWHLLAALAARQLDPDAAVPGRLETGAVA